MRRRRYRRRRRRRNLMLRRILGRGISRPYINKRKHLMLGSGSKSRSSRQTGGFFPLAAALTGAPPIIDLLGKIIR